MKNTTPKVESDGMRNGANASPTEVKDSAPLSLNKAGTADTAPLARTADRKIAVHIWASPVHANKCGSIGENAVCQICPLPTCSLARSGIWFDPAQMRAFPRTAAASIASAPAEGCTPAKSASGCALTCDGTPAMRGKLGHPGSGLPAPVTIKRPPSLTHSRNALC